MRIFRYNICIYICRRSLEVTNETVVSDRLEYRKWTQTEQLAHVGLTSMQVVAVADQAKQTIQMTAAPFYGMVIGLCIWAHVMSIQSTYICISTVKN